MKKRFLGILVAVFMLLPCFLLFGGCDKAESVSGKTFLFQELKTSVAREYTHEEIAEYMYDHYSVEVEPDFGSAELAEYLAERFGDDSTEMGFTFKADGTIYMGYDDEDDPVTWKQKGSKITLTIMVARNQQNVTANVVEKHAETAVFILKGKKLYFSEIQMGIKVQSIFVESKLYNAKGKTYRVSGFDVELEGGLTNEELLQINDSVGLGIDAGEITAERVLEGLFAWGESHIEAMMPDVRFNADGTADQLSGGEVIEEGAATWAQVFNRVIVTPGAGDDVIYDFVDGVLTMQQRNLDHVVFNVSFEEAVE